MGSMNKVVLIGRLGQDPEVRQAGSTAVCNLSVATSERYKDRSGEQQEKTEWHRVTVWGQGAEACGQYLRKGREVAICGKLETDEWTDKDGNKRKTTKVVADRFGGVVFLGKGGEQDQGRHQDGGGSQGGYGAGPPKVRTGWGDPAPAQQRTAEGDPLSEEDLPF